MADAGADSEMTWAISLIDTVRSARAQMNVPAGLYVPVLQLDGDAEAATALANNETLIKRLARIDSISPATTAPKGAITIPTKGATFCLPLADIIDVSAEKARLEKALGKLGKEIGGLEGRLNNPNFATSAPPEVVAEVQANLALRQEEQTQLGAALARLRELD
jgi:valyl-tRNA synthetase